MNSRSVVDQIREAAQRRNRLATFAGFALGGFVPLASYTLAHSEVDPARPLWVQVPAGLVCAGLVYSAKTVYDWSRSAFRHPVKALGFVALLEGVMTFARTPWLASSALGILLAINGIATGVNLALDSRAGKREERAAVRKKARALLRAV